MRKYSLRLLLAVIVATLCAAAHLTLYAKDGPKQKAHGAFVSEQEMWPGVVDKCFFHFGFEAPDEGYFSYYDFYGPWAGSWAHTSVMQLYFTTYNGSVAEIAGRPIVYYLNKVVRGEEIFNPDYPGIPDPNYQPPYQNIENWYRVGAVGDGGPGHEFDWKPASFPIPPQGLQWLCDLYGICGTGEEQAQTIFYGLIVGAIDMGYQWATEGNINIKTK